MGCSENKYFNSSCLTHAHRQTGERTLCLGSYGRCLLMLRVPCLFLEGVHPFETVYSVVEIRGTSTDFEPVCNHVLDLDAAANRRSSHKLVDWDDTCGSKKV